MPRTMKTILVPVEAERTSYSVYINPALIESLAQTSPRTVTMTMSSGDKYAVPSGDLKSFAAFVKGAENSVTIADDDDT